MRRFSNATLIAFEPDDLLELLMGPSLVQMILSGGRRPLRTPEP